MLISDWSSDVCSSDLLAKVAFKLVGLRDAITGSAGKTGAHGISLDLTRVADRQKQLTGRGKMQGRTPTDGTYDLHARALADRKGAVKRKGVSVRVELGGRRSSKNQKIKRAINR